MGGRCLSPSLVHAGQDASPGGRIIRQIGYRPGPESLILWFIGGGSQVGAVRRFSSFFCGFPSRVTGVFYEVKSAPRGPAIACPTRRAGSPPGRPPRRADAQGRLSIAPCVRAGCPSVFPRRRNPAPQGRVLASCYPNGCLWVSVRCDRSGTTPPYFRPATHPPAAVLRPPCRRDTG